MVHLDKTKAQGLHTGSLVCNTPRPHPQVLRNRGVGAMTPTAPKFFCACFPFIKPSMF